MKVIAPCSCESQQGVWSREGSSGWQPERPESVAPQVGGRLLSKTSLVGSFFGNELGSNVDSWSQTRVAQFRMSSLLNSPAMPSKSAHSSMPKLYLPELGRRPSLMPVPRKCSDGR